MEDEDGAQLAIRKLDGSDWSGRRLQVPHHPLPVCQCAVHIQMPAAK